MYIPPSSDVLIMHQVNILYCMFKGGSQLKLAKNTQCGGGVSHSNL